MIIEWIPKKDPKNLINEDQVGDPIEGLKDSKDTETSLIGDRILPPRMNPGHRIINSKQGTQLLLPKKETPYAQSLTNSAKGRTLCRGPGS